jgi:predicted GNAT family acetyltransferase
VEEARLDNAVYAALSGPHRRFAVASGRALRYDPEVAPFLALPSDASGADWHDALTLVKPGGYAAVVHSGIEVPPLWTALRAFEVVQMVAERVAGAEEPEAVTLTVADVPEMLELVRATDPGPFLPRTIELGRYIGLRRDGVLIAMAGERMHVDGWREVSAVCTDPAYRGQGLASRLMAAIIAGIQARSERPFLHVMASNESAIRLYEQLGFRIRGRATITVVTRS